MAAHGESDRRQPQFTLPISCQVCLGKVKQPVVCPNLHVFCERCLEVWLKRNNQCPSCRAVIGPENPAKHIIGGQAEEEHPISQSCPELRRARFDLLYLEYEDQIEQLKKENLILRTENNILVTQVKEGDKAKENGRTKSGQGSSDSAHGNQISNPDGPSLLMVTRNLQEAQKLYSNLKSEMAHIKQENGKMKDENVALTRENENLRLELAQRSPKKFGRYTVATLETKVSEQEKEIRQLTKALERSDAYIEELQQKLAGPDSKAAEAQRRRGSPESSASGPTFHINTDPEKSKERQGQSAEHFSFRLDKPLPSDKARRLLFGKVFVDEPPSTRTAKQQQREAGASSKSQDGPRHSIANSSNQELLRQAAKRTHPVPESILKTHSSAGRREGQVNMDTLQEGETPRRVHFDFPPPPPPRTPDECPSFDLELPSPMDRSTSTPRTAVSSGCAETEPQPSGMEEESHWEDSEFDTKVKDLLRKNASTLKRSGSLETVSSQLQHSAKKSNKGQKGRMRETGTAVGKIIKRPSFQDANDSSRLSVPDESSADATNDFSEMEDPDTESRTGDTDLNISMTPELSDCLKLLDKAEKNMVSAPTATAASELPPSSALPPRPSSVPPNLSRPYVSSSVASSSNHHSAGFSASTTGSGTIKGWEQQFYSSLRTNPYKQPSSNGGSSQQETYPSFSSLGKHEVSDRENGYRQESRHTYLPRPSSPSFSFQNSHRKTVQAPETQHLYSSHSHTSFPASSHLPTASSSRPSSALPSKFNFRGGSSTSAPSSNLLGAPSSSSHGSLSSSIMPTTFSFSSLMSQPVTSGTDSFKFSSSSSAHFPSSSGGRIDSNTSLVYSNPLPPSLNNSALEWPEGASPSRLSPHSFLSANHGTATPSRLSPHSFLSANHGMATPSRLSPHSFLSANHGTAALDISSSADPSQLREFTFTKRPGRSEAADFPNQLVKLHHNQQTYRRQSQAHPDDDSFSTAMEPPAGGYPQDLSHDNSSTSEVDLFSSPRHRRFSYPFVPENMANGDLGRAVGMDDFLERP